MADLNRFLGSAAYKGPGRELGTAKDSGLPNHGGEGKEDYKRQEGGPTDGKTGKVTTGFTNDKGYSAEGSDLGKTEASVSKDRGNQPK